MSGLHVCVHTYVRKGVCIYTCVGWFCAVSYTGRGYSCVPLSDNVKHLVVLGL